MGKTKGKISLIRRWRAGSSELDILDETFGGNKEYVDSNKDNHDALNSCRENYGVKCYYLERLGYEKYRRDVTVSLECDNYQSLPRPVTSTTSGSSAQKEKVVAVSRQANINAKTSFNNNTSAPSAQRLSKLAANSLKTRAAFQVSTSSTRKCVDDPSTRWDSRSADSRKTGHGDQYCPVLPCAFPFYEQ